MADSLMKRFFVDDFKRAIKESDIEGDYCVLKHTVMQDVVVVKQDGVEEDGFTLNFKISDASIDSEGDTISTNGWDFKRYQKNPVVLFAHDGDQPPVGKASNLEVKASKNDSDAVFSDVTFTPKDLFPFGNMIGRMVKAGFLKAASVGFIPLKGEFAEDRAEDYWMPFDFSKQELLEWSVVPVPANPNAIQGAKSMGIDVLPLTEWAEKVLDGQKSGIYVPRHRIEEIYSETKGNPVTVQVQEKDPGEEKPAEEEAPAEPKEEAPAEEPEAPEAEASEPAPEPEPADEADEEEGLDEEEAKAFAAALLKEACKDPEFIRVLAELI